VVLANYFHEHAPFAIKALGAGKHVMSECTCNATLAEGVALCRAVEQSGKIYMLAENYPYTKFHLEMRRLYQTGEIGHVTYAEGEYNHPIDPQTLNTLSPGLRHWRNWIPSTYYCTHAMGPLMYITKTRPVSVNAQCIPFFESDHQNRHVRQNDASATMLCRMSNGGLVVINGTMLRGHGSFYRVHGTRGLMENLRGEDSKKVRLVHNDFELEAGQVKEKVYLPEWPAFGKEAQEAGHGGGDFFVINQFAASIRENKAPYLDVYTGVDMTLVGIMGYKSALQNGQPVEIPDFRNEEVRKKYENDHFSPYPGDRGANGPFPSIKGEIKPTQAQKDFAHQIWSEKNNSVK
jgi:predicted dehydrogenase